jgi:hypothetical protein
MATWNSGIHRRITFCTLVLGESLAIRDAVGVVVLTRGLSVIQDFGNRHGDASTIASLPWVRSRGLVFDELPGSSDPGGGVRAFLVKTPPTAQLTGADRQWRC